MTKLGGTNGKQKKSKGRRGRISWVSGTKFKFLDDRSAQWQECLDGGSSSTFYNFITCLWIKKYGWFFDHWSDLDEDTPDPENDELDFEEGLSADEESLQKRDEYFSAMRLVS
jgi:hypothetical protein